MKRFVYNQKYARLLVSMAGKTSQIDELAKKINANAGHLRIVLDQWSKEGVIEKDKPGRDYHIRLTKKGEAISLKLAELMELVDHWGEKPVAETTHKCTCVTRPIEEAEKEDYPEGTDIIVDEMCKNCQKEVDKYEKEQAEAKKAAGDKK